MSSNVVSQSPAPDRKDVQMDLPSSSISLPDSGSLPTIAANSLSDSGMHNFSASKEALILNNSGFKTTMIMNKQVGGSIVSSPMWMSNQPGHKDFVSQNNFACEKMLHPVKRKAEVGASFSDSGTRESQVPNKRLLHIGTDVHPLGFPQPSAFQKKTTVTQPKSGSSGLSAQHLLNKKIVRNDSIPGKIGSEAVRCKMKESLSSALSLVKQNHISNRQKDQIGGTGSDEPVDSTDLKPDSIMGVCVLGPNSGLEDVVFSQESSVNVQMNSKVSSAELTLNPNNLDDVRTFNEFQYSSILPDDDITFSDSFFVKDDLLQGNGLSWAFDFDVHMSEKSEAQNSEKQASKQDSQCFSVRDNVAILIPENVASQIELELFKLFGGVNKKYKEKGRSLLFNLKDRSNPELRERVMSGEISPDRLCSMSAEDLASKELSQWRMAKAKELAQMVVLPDTEVDVRRLVRKTHKGEYQVEIEHDDGISAEASGGSSVLTLPLPKTEPLSPLVVDSKDREIDIGQKSSSGNQDVSGSLVIQTDGSDLMQGMMVDELKDSEFLPPIVSLDEFMESLNSEPPFESLSADAAQKTSVVNKESLEAVNKSQASARDSEYPNDTPSRKADVFKKPDVSTTALTLSRSPVKQNALPDNASGMEYMWKGILQLNTSASITVGCMYQSGEKTSSEKWPASFEIMGRVKLDSFEKFIRELPLSRTRAVMVLELVLCDKSSESESSYLSEAVESYAAEERVGYAEPTTGVELYLCPPTSRMIDVLKPFMRRERSDTDNSSDNKLIGVVVWRRAHISNTLSPNSSSHNKHSSKKPSPALPKHVQDFSNANVNQIPTPSSVLKNVAHLIPETRHDEDDDVPPGFGHMVASSVAKDDDDLPEFNFSGRTNPSFARIPTQNLHQPNKRSVNQLRELIQKYGQSGTDAPNMGPGIKKLNYDDDDDIPEWQPETSTQLRPQLNAATVGLRPHIPAAMQQMPVMSPQTSRSLLPHSPLGGQWARPPGHQHDQRWRQN